MVQELELSIPKIGHTEDGNKPGDAIFEEMVAGYKRSYGSGWRRELAKFVIGSGLNPFNVIKQHPGIFNRFQADLFLASAYREKFERTSGLALSNVSPEDRSHVEQVIQGQIRADHSAWIIAESIRNKKLRENP